MPERPVNIRQGCLKSRLSVAVLAFWMLLAGSGLAVGQPVPSTEGPPPSDPRPVPDGPGKARRVLLLYGAPRLTPAIVAVDTAIRSTIESRSPVPVTFYTEYLDFTLFGGDEPQPELRALLQRKYATRPIDLIVANASRPLRVALRNRKDLFSNAPVVFVSVDPKAAADLRFDADVTGTWLHIGWTETLDLARRLQPDIRRAVVIGGVTPADRVWLDQARQQLAMRSGSVEVEYLAGLSLEDVLKAVAALSTRTVVLVGPFLRDVTGRDFVMPEAIGQIAASSSVPTYGVMDSAVGAGAVGGHVVSFEAHGRIAADLALRVLAGERPPPTEASTTVSMVDARQLARWHLDARRLPAGTVVRFRELSAWERYRWWIVGAATLVLVQSVLIAALLVHRALRRRAERALAERLRFETLLSDLSTMFAAASVPGLDSHIETALSRLTEDLGIDRATLVAFPPSSGEVRVTHAWTRDGVAPPPEMIRDHEVPWILAELRGGRVVRLGRPEDLPGAAMVDRRSIERFGTRPCVVLPLMVGGLTIGGFAIATLHETRPWPEELVARLRILADLFASALARRDAELTAHESATQIQTLAGRLITAQEAERRRIARELHDGLSQRLTALSLTLSRLGRLPPSASADLPAELHRLEARAADLVGDMRRVSHELHPGVLEHIGLIAALDGYCSEVEKAQGLAVSFQADDLGAVPADLALCLYRATQEALGNIVKHAAAQSVRVRLVRDGRDGILTIDDDGRGFDPANARSGLGLISLEERVRLVGGQLAITTAHGRGTEVRIVVPLPEDADVPGKGPAR